MASPALVEVTDVENGSLTVKDGPVVTMMNKRLRALKKKFNRITQIEEQKSQGKTINKEQEEVLKSKPQVLVLIEEYERLRQPLAVALKEEIEAKEKEWVAAKAEQEQVASADKEADAEGLGSNGSGEEAGTEVSNEVDVNGTEEEGEGVEAVAFEDVVTELDDNIGDLIRLLYFAQLFDVNLSEAWMKYHERNSCLSYDFVTDDDSAAPLTDADLAALASFGSLVTSRPPNATISHKNALQNCISHARNWLLSSDVPIDGVNMTYADLRDRLNRILVTDYFTMTPELQTVNRPVPEEEPYGDGDGDGDVSTEIVSDGSGNNESTITQAEVHQEVEETKPENSAERAVEMPSADSSPSDEKAQVFQRQPGNVNGRHKQQHGRGGGYGRGPRGYVSGRGSGRGGRGRGFYDGSYNPGKFESSGRYYPQQRYYEQGGYAPVNRYHEQGGGYRPSKNQGNGGGGGGGGGNYGGRRGGGRQYNNESSGHANGRAVAAQSG